MPSFRIPAAVPGAAIAALGLVLGAAAVTPASADQPAGMQLAQASYGDEKLQAFASAAVQIRQIREDYTAQIQQAESEEQRQQLAQDANAEMVGAVESAPGISVEEYNAIIEASAEDQELTKRINEHMESAAQ